MNIDSSADLVAALANTRLLDPPELDEVREVVLPRHSDAKEMAANLVAQSRLTSYQAQQLLQGQGETLMLGGYRLLEPIGEGGMGQVFKAEQRRLHRVVALKVIQQQCLSRSPDAVRRFQREALAAAKLSHPHVIAVYDAGQEGDTHFLVMEYVVGMDLARLVARFGAMPIKASCQFISQAALGLQHAHDRGMIHRDIKPSNLLITRSPLAPEPEPGVGQAEDLLTHGILKILDMGLARLVEAMDKSVGSALTQEGKVVGTPDYIAPEQARSANHADGRSDIYSLGCTLYHLLAGKPPFPAGTLIEKLLMHQLDEPEALTQARPDVPAGLAEVVHRMLAKAPDDRFQKPREIHDALQPFTRGVDQAPPPPVAPRPAPVHGGLSMVTPILPDVSPINSFAPLTPTTPVPRPSIANSWVANKPPAPPVVPAGPDVPMARELARMKAHGGCVMALAFAPDRNTLASAGLDESVRLWDFSQGEGRERAVLPARGDEVACIQFSRDQKVLAAGTSKGRLCLWNLTGAAPVLASVVEGHNMAVKALAFAADNSALISAGVDGKVVLWDFDGAKLLQRAVLQAKQETITALAFAPDGKRIVTGTQQGAVLLWSPRRYWNRESARVQVTGGAISSLAFAPDGREVACGCRDRKVALIEVGEDDLKKPRAHPGTWLGPVRAVQYRPDGQTIDTLEDGGRKCVWPREEATAVETWTVPFVRVYSNAMTFDGRYLATGNSEGRVVVYRVAPKRQGK